MVIGVVVAIAVVAAVVFIGLPMVKSGQMGLGAGPAKSISTSTFSPTQIPTLAPTPVATTVILTPVTTEPILTTPVTTSIHVPTNTVSLSNDLTITYPTDWEKEELSETSLREYGQITTNIANFFSPDVTWERNHGVANPDRSQFTTLSIDVDPQPVSDNDRYFNLATVAIQNELGSIEITKHEQLALAKGISGYKTYALEFEKKEMKRYYYFVDVDGTFYIITIKNPLPYSTEVGEMIGSIKITPPSSQKQR